MIFIIFTDPRQKPFPCKKKNISSINRLGPDHPKRIQKIPKNLIGISVGICHKLLNGIKFKTKGRGVKIRVVVVFLAYFYPLLIGEGEDILKISIFSKRL